MADLITLVLVLNVGTVKIELNPEIAPRHVAQITQLVEQKSYDGITFHRVIPKNWFKPHDLEFNKNFKHLDLDKFKEIYNITVENTKK